MGRTAVVFSGQGAQNTGMGYDLYTNFASAKKVFEAAEKLRKGIMRQCFEGTAEELSLTVNTQPCLFTVDVAAAAALSECGIQGDITAGFSLGEFAALVYAKCLDFEQCFILVTRRAEIMHRAALKSGGGMAAVLKATAADIEKLCDEIGGVYPVNYNCPGQTVIAGSENALKIFTEKAAEIGAKVIRLSVSGAFHSPYMGQAYNEFSELASRANFSAPKLPLYSNVTAQPYGQNIAQLISLQIKSPVLWQNTIENMITNGADTFIEAGTGKTLCGLIKRISPQAKIFSAENSAEIKKISGEANNGA